jgi:hypothetical protein
MCKQKGSDDNDDDDDDVLHLTSFVCYHVPRLSADPDDEEIDGQVDEGGRLVCGQCGCEAIGMSP